MSHKRILIFSLAYYPVEGGAEIAVKEITTRLPSIEFDIITLRFNKTHSPKEKIGNCTIYRINTSKNLYPFKAFLFAKTLHKNKSYDAIWAIMANWAGLAALFFKFRFPEVPYVLTLQEGDPISQIRRKVWFIYPLFKRIFLRADVIVTISKYLADWAREMGYRGRVEVIPNGVDVGKFAGVKRRVFDRGKVVLITTSRLVEKNAVGDIIEALKFLSDNVSLKIIGTGPLEGSLKLKVENLKLEERIKFLGNIEHYDISKYLHEADIFVRPSLSEGFGNSFIEAMAAGLPVIATPVGGIVDFVEDPTTAGQAATGFFCEVRNPESIVRQVKRIINEPELRERIVRNAFLIVRERYEWNLVAKKMENLFKNIMS